jgi:hypothetical protein
MPIRAPELLGLQRRSLPLGEIRIGTSKEVPGKKGRQPVRLETFRFTLPTRQTAEAVAAHYESGTVAPWTQRRGYFEVITDRTALDVWVPARGQPVDTSMELWDGQRRLRRCDGVTEELSGKPCMCPLADDAANAASVRRAHDERNRLSKLRPPQACKVLTRISVTIPDLPGMTGVFRINTGSENAAVEIADSGEAMEIAREGGVYLPAVLFIHWRKRADDGSPYPVLSLQIGLSMRQIAQGQLPAGPAGLIAQLQGTPEQRALPAPRVPADDGEVPPAELPAGPGDDAGPGGFLTSGEDAAQMIADLAGLASSGDDINKLVARCRSEQIAPDVTVCTDRDPEVHEPLGDYLKARYTELTGEPA